ncbi:MAG: hypothetical protein ABI222_05445 [Opitutaceae bacterium]
MQPSSPTPKLPLWIFLVADVVLVLTACFIAYGSSRPLSATSIYAIVTCVVGGAILLAIPLVLHYERAKNEILDDRQRALEALAETVTTSAEQISIAVQGLHTIAELTQKNLQQAEQIPAQFQAKVVDFEALLTNAQSDEREEMKEELARLRASETDRLETIATKVDHAAAELAKLEATAQKHLAAAQTALAQAPQALTAATARAVAEIESKLAARATAIVTEPTSAKPAGTSAESGVQIMPVAPPTAAPFAGNLTSIAPASESSKARAVLDRVGPPTAAPLVSTIISDPPKRSIASDAEILTAPPFAGHFLSSPPAPTTELTPATTLPAETSASEPASTVVAPPEKSASDNRVPEESKPGRKRTPRKPKSVEVAEVLPALGLDEEPFTTPTAPASNAPPEDFSQAAPDETSSPAAEVSETVISSDRATRLLVTAYIGIGNRLFIRGDGPGLSWDKGVPLQFVSIGKWRWETAEATAPVKFKLYKNDELECTALGAQALSPEHQQELTATF